ncbi:hypothetical protein CD134_04530 [Staphylococcus lutrae]|uniref:Competence protein ComK n=2 Tax=Staphylococcus lutrae TaxID=155085 RepID=A0AAC9RXP3_9STAP|nr:hypothetical protein B5P37_01160 [Staphylococcus lutrae]PNZ38381.1 hypothetical protein CD134_04530 [Staphylococcus lutrae]
MSLSQHDAENILFIKTAQQLNYRTFIQYSTYNQRSQLNLKQYLNHLAYRFHKEIRTQKKQARALLNVSKMVPIFMDLTLILCPLLSQRAPIQYYINMAQVVAASSQRNETCIHFKNNTTLVVPIPLHQFVSQWKDAHMLSTLIIN